ncbi:trypsin-like serine protease [Photobacterium damselae]
MNRVRIILLGILFPITSNAIVINENIFYENGGDLNNIKDSIKYKNERLREKSYSQPFLTVGKLYGCTGTWLGNDSSGWTYILTAAHCVPYKDEITQVDRAFRSWDNRIIADGKGFAYVPKERIHKPSGFGGASTDIAILKLPTVDILTDKDGQLVSPPIVNDQFNEFNQVVQFVGYGTWGVGLDVSGGYGPAKGDRRLYGESIIDDIFEMEHGISASYQPSGKTKKWARVAPGDSGSAWWQESKGISVIIATTNGGASKYTTGARVSKYTNWIKGVYKDVRLLSNEFLRWGHNDKKGVIGDYYKYQNPYNGDLEFFELTSLNNSGRYWYFPTDKSDNTYWKYRGPFTWSSTDNKGEIGDIYIYNNPYNQDRELFKLVGLNNSGRYWYFPTDKSSNKYWKYIKTLD